MSRKETWRRKLPRYRQLWEVSIDGQKISVVAADARDVVERALYELDKGAGEPFTIHIQWKDMVS